MTLIGGDDPATGISITSDVPGTSQITVRNNFINGWFRGVSSPSLEGITVRGNHFTGNSSNALNGSGIGLIDAGFNFYGTTDPVVVDSLVAASFDFLPFLTDGTDADPATPGFNPCSRPPSSIDTTATYTDPDGDLVTVKVSKGVLGDADFRFELPERGDGFILDKLAEAMTGPNWTRRTSPSRQSGRQQVVTVSL